MTDALSLQYEDQQDNLLKEYVLDLLGAHEVLVLTHERQDNNCFFRVETVFCSDHLVYQRVSWMMDPAEGWKSENGWAAVLDEKGRCLAWTDRDSLEYIAKAAQSKGWKVDWRDY